MTANPLERGVAGEKSGLRAALKHWLAILLAIVGLYLLLRTEIARPSVWGIVLWAILFISLASFAFSSGITETFGEVGYVQISSSKLEEQIRKRYQYQIDELLRLGFSHRFSVGQTFPVVNLVLIFPAIILLVMWWKREVIALLGGKNILVGRAVCTSGDMSTFANPGALGITFYTQIQYGPVVISTNIGSNNQPNHSSLSKFEKHVYKGASISDAWRAHKQLLQLRVTNGAEIDRDMSFNAYVSINS